MDRHIQKFLLTGVFLFGALTLAPAPSYADCSSPVSPHGGRDFIYSSAGSTENLCDSTDTWKNLRDVDESGAGIRQLIQFGDDEGACTTAKTGRIRYSSVGSWDYCDGSAWTALTSAASVDKIHDADGNTQVQTEKNPNEDKIRFDTGGTERMIIDGSAVQITSTPLRVQVTTGNQPQSGPAASMALNDLTDVNTSGHSDGSALLYSSAASGWVAGTVSGSPGGSDKDIQFNDNGTFGYDANLVWDKVAKRLSITGDIAYTGIMTDVSDRRLKEDIMPLPPELKNILTLQPVSFSMKSDPTHAREFGLIAQDVEPVFPDLVITKPDGTKAMNYIGLISPLIAAVKEQQALIEKQQQQITALEKQLADQARRLDALEKQ